MPHGMRWAQCCNSVCHARGLQTENELSLQSIPCQNHLFSFAQYSSILPRLVFLRAVFGLLLKKKKSNQKRKPWINKIKGNVLRFCTPTFHTAENTVQNQRRYFSVVHLFLAQLCKTPSSWDSVLGVCSPAFQKGQESNQAHPWHTSADVLASVPGMQSPRCSFSLGEDKQQLFIVHVGQAREIMKQGLKSTFTPFNFFMYVLRNVAWGPIFH